MNSLWKKTLEPVRYSGQQNNLSFFCLKVEEDFDPGAHLLSKWVHTCTKLLKCHLVNCCSWQEKPVAYHPLSWSVVDMCHRKTDKSFPQLFQSEQCAERFLEQHNKQEERCGSVFQRSFQEIMLSEDSHQPLWKEVSSTQTLWKEHLNPMN